MENIFAWQEIVDAVYEDTKWNSIFFASLLMSFWCANVMWIINENWIRFSFPFDGTTKCMACSRWAMMSVLIFYLSAFVRLQFVICCYMSQRSNYDNSLTVDTKYQAYVKAITIRLVQKHKPIRRNNEQSSVKLPDKLQSVDSCIVPYPIETRR